MADLLDEDKLREGFTSLYLAWKEYERAVIRQLADISRRVDDLRNRIEILEVRQAGRDRDR